MIYSDRWVVKYISGIITGENTLGRRPRCWTVLSSWKLIKFERGRCLIRIGKGGFTDKGNRRDSATVFIGAGSRYSQLLEVVMVLAWVCVASSFHNNTPSPINFHHAATSALQVRSRWPNRKQELKPNIQTGLSIHCSDYSPACSPTTSMKQTLERHHLQISGCIHSSNGNEKNGGENVRKRSEERQSRAVWKRRSLLSRPCYGKRR